MNPENLKFNLIDDPWINVVGHPRQSLRMLFSTPDLRRFSGNAVDKIALLRFLLALTHAAVKIPDTRSWQELAVDDMAQAVLRYLEEHHDEFELFGERPFLQFPQLRSARKTQPYAALQPSVSSGNKPVLSHWNWPQEPATADLPLLLLRGCGFGLGGKKYDNSLVLTPGYAGKLNKKGTPLTTGVPGTLLGRKGYLHCYWQGETLLETIRLNLLTEEEVAELRSFPRGMGRPCWENMPQGEDCPRAQEYRETYQGTLLPLDKFYLFLPGKVVMTDAIHYLNDFSARVDPALTIFREKNKIRAVWANPEQRPWRELPAILAFLRAGQTSKSPHTLSCGLRKIAPDMPFHIWAGGVQVSSNAGEQYISGTNDYVESEFHFPNSSRLIEPCYQKYSNIIREADACARTLYSSVAGYYKELQDLSGAGIASRASAVFYEQLGGSAQQLVDAAFSETITDEEVPPDLKRQWQTLISRLYARFCPADTARQLLAWSSHEPFLKAAKKTGKRGRS